ncbi:MAG: hypothetical protein CVV39_06145 [Planctomycetes bacterium HGW-Planctomycetes-1]|nr:MAG: hypothetical protein CVV39_06145 [Planctomycetes bacterium HGW-Planctomycetes-1]
MTDNFTQNSQQLIEQLSRGSGGLNESSFVTSTGGRAAGFVGRVVSRYNRNHYYVRFVELGPCGTVPMAYGSEFIAVNVAESFTAQGNLAFGTYVIVFKIGEYYCFYVQV